MNFSQVVYLVGKIRIAVLVNCVVVFKASHAQLGIDTVARGEQGLNSLVVVLQFGPIDLEGLLIAAPIKAVKAALWVLSDLLEQER